jgi:hypothetical protein
VGPLPWLPNSNILDWKWQEADRLAAPAGMLDRRALTAVAGAARPLREKLLAVRVLPERSHATVNLRAVLTPRAQFRDIGGVTETLICVADGASWLTAGRRFYFSS